MKKVIVLFAVILSVASVFAADPNQPDGSYGTAAVSRILTINDDCTLFCNIEGFPAIIGQNMPVMLKDLKPATTPEANQKIKAFLSRLLLNESDPPGEVTLCNIQRGTSFCLCADILHNGNDVSQLLIKNGLAYRIIKVNAPEPVQPPEEAAVIPVAPATRVQPAATEKPTPQKSGYVASKNSKVFHCPDCYHVRRMNTANAIHFKTRQEALKTGRRPCKSCNP